MMKTCRPLALLLVSTLLLAVCGDNDKTQAGDFGQIQIPDVSQLVQMAEAEAGSSSVTFTTLAAWSTSIRETRTETPAGIGLAAAGLIVGIISCISGLVSTGISIGNTAKSK